MNKGFTFKWRVLFGEGGVVSLHCPFTKHQSSVNHHPEKTGLFWSMGGGGRPGGMNGGGGANAQEDSHRNGQRPTD